MKKFLQRILDALTKHKKKSAAVVAGGLIAGTAYGFYTPPPFAVDVSGFPNAATTGGPDGVVLTPYTGPSLITSGTVLIDKKRITGGLEVRGTGHVTVTNSLLDGGSLWLDYDTYPNASLTVSDSTLVGGYQAGTVLGGGGFTATRVEITGGNRSVLCDTKCTVQDSWVHGQFHDTSGIGHESGIRVGDNATIRHNTIACDAPEFPPDGGCSAPITGYPDFEIIHDNVIDNNFLRVTNGAFCLYGGDSPGKQFSGQTHHITITNNVFEVTAAWPNCGIYGTHDSFPYTDPNSVWSNNRTTTGEQLPSHW